MSKRTSYHDHCPKCFLTVHITIILASCKINQMAPTGNKTKRSDEDENVDCKRRKGLDGGRVNDQPVDEEVHQRRKNSKSTK